MSREHDDAGMPADGLPEGYELPPDDELDEDTNPRDAVDDARADARTSPADGSDTGTVAEGSAERAEGETGSARPVPAARETLGASVLPAGVEARTARSVERVEDEPVEPVDPARRRLGMWIAAGGLVLLLGGIAATVSVLASGDGAAAPSSSATTHAETTTAPAPSMSPVPSSSASPASSTQPTPSATSVIAPELAPVKPNQPATGDDGVIVELSKIESVDGDASLPGEMSGPAIRVTVQLQNASTQPIDLGAVVVNAYTGPDRAPATTVTEPGGAPFSGELAVGKRASGVYLFTVPLADRGDVFVGVDYRVGTSTVTFRGTVG